MLNRKIWDSSNKYSDLIKVITFRLFCSLVQYLDLFFSSPGMCDEVIGWNLHNFPFYNVLQRLAHQLCIERI